MIENFWINMMMIIVAQQYDIVNAADVLEKD